MMEAARSGANAGRVVLVTGASSGVGRAIALALAAEGVTVGLVGRDAGRLGSAALETSARGGKPIICPTDLDRPQGLRVLSERVADELGGVDVLVHAAGVIAVGPTKTADLDDLDRQYRTNLRAPYELTQLLLPSLIEREGQIVFINSTQGIYAGPGAGQYAATKHGLRALADSLRAEVNRDRVRVLTVVLGRTATPMQETLHGTEGRAYRPELLIQPEDVAAMVVGALALPRSAEVTELRMRPFQPPGEGS